MQNITKEGELIPFCLADVDLDCPRKCPLHPHAVAVVNEMAERNNLSFSEVIDKTRQLDEIEKAQVRSLNRGCLVVTGNLERCIRLDETKPGIGIG